MIFPGHASPQGKHAGSYDPSTSMTRRLLQLAIGLVIAALLLWPVAEPFMLQEEYVSLRHEDLPAGIGQLRIVYVTDIHKGGLFTASRVQGLINRINAADADLVLLGGDYAMDSDSAIDFFIHLPRIHSRYGVFAVLGNHDRTLPESNLTQLKAAMRSAGVTPLVNSVSQVRIGLSDIFIAGVDDVNNGHPDLAAVSRQVSAKDYVIFLCHSPAIIPDALRATDRNGSVTWFDLGLFGHTHGGQVAVLGPMLRSTSVPDEYMSGWVRRNRIDLLISNGVGTTGLPLRWMCPPQIHVITVTTPK